MKKTRNDSYSSNDDFDALITRDFDDDGDLEFSVIHMNDHYGRQIDARRRLEILREEMELRMRIEGDYQDD
jgi:hypothetical protein